MRRPGDPVPNQFPVVEPPGAARIALVGQSPGREEDYYGKPFCGTAGALLDSSLERCGLTRSQCFVGNVCQHRPNEANDFNRLEWSGEQVQQGIAQLRADLERFQPSIVCCLGNEALHLFKHGNTPPAKRKGVFDWPSKVGDWRGSLFASDFLSREAIPGSNAAQTDPGQGNTGNQSRLKCLAAYHPAFVARDYSQQAYYRCAPGVGDLERLRVEAGTRELALPVREIAVLLRLRVVLEVLAGFREERLPVAMDIEGRPDDITCIAFSRHADTARVIPFSRLNHSRVWSAEDEAVIWSAIKALLEDPQVLKIGQWFSYDAFCIEWTKGIKVKGEVHDIAEMFWELFAELDKGLDVQASLLTKEPFYKPAREKGEMKFESDEQFWRYNGTDAAVTFECWERMQAMIGGGTNAHSRRSHFAFNASLFAPKLAMMMRGIRVDRERMQAAQDKAAQGVWELQAVIDTEACRKEPQALYVLEQERLHRLYHGCAEERDFAEVCLAQLGGANPRVRRDVVIERWQPMRWKPKLALKGDPGAGRWVKDGKLMTSLAVAFIESNHWIGEREPQPGDSGRTWLKPAPKTVSRLQAFTPAALVDCEEHVLESKRSEWRRVKQIWKELKHEQQSKAQAATQVHGQAERGRGHDPTGPVDCNDETAARGCEVSGGANERAAEVPSSPRSALLGELAVLLGLGVNVGGTNEGGDSQRFLYETCALPRIYCDAKTGRYSKESEAEWRRRTKAKVKHERQTNRIPAGLSAETASPGRIDGEGMAGSDGETAGLITRSTTKRPSTDQTALDKLYADTQDVRVLWVLQQRRLRKVVTDLNVKLDPDGRLRASISLVKETGRMSESAAPTGCGLNRQALNKDLLEILVADDGCEMCKLDLEGADSWTVACECAALGDSTMLDDLKAGIKPARVLCLLYSEGSHVNGMFRDEIKDHCERMKFPSWLYPGCKAIAHGTPYGMGWQTLQMTLLKNSMADLPLQLADAKPIVLSKAQIDDLQAAFFSRYPGVKQWQAKEAANLLDKGYIQTSTGHVRRFYGRKSEFAKGRKVVNHETWKEALASKPQFYTTYAIKQAWRKMWYDEENWRGRCVPGSRKLEGVVFDGAQIVEALALKHDEILTQWRVEDREFARRKLREWFQTPVTIAGIEVVIPAAGKIGRDWSMKDGEKF